LRTILYTGKGGVGKTSVAAATALKAAGQGKNVLVMSTDPAHSLSDAFDAPIGPDPKKMATGVWAQEMDHTAMIEENWAEIQSYVSTVFEWQGANTLAAEELAMLPGMDELFGLLMVRRHHQEQMYDALIVDAAPTGETLKLLSLPDQMNWYVEKILPIQRRAAKLVRPFANRAKSLPPLPEDSVFAAGQRFYEAIAGVEEILTDREQASVRLVVNAEKMVVAEARRAYTYLNLYDYGVDAVVVNRLLPDSVTDPYFSLWREAQGRHMESIEESFSPIPILTARLFDREMFGLEALGALSDDVFDGRRVRGGFQPAAGGEEGGGPLEARGRALRQGRKLQAEHTTPRFAGPALGGGGEHRGRATEGEARGWNLSGAVRVDCWV
jgi:arsenite-transporting ATPase